MLGLGLGPYILIGVYLALLAAAIVSVVRMPEIGLYAFIPLIPNQTVRYKLHEMPYGAQLVDLLLIAVAVGIVLKGKSLFPKSALRFPIFALWGLTFLTLWTGSILNDLPLPLIDSSDERFSMWKNYCRIFLLFFLAAGALRTRKQMLIAVGLMCLGVLWTDRGFLISLKGRSFESFSYALRDAGTMPIAGENGIAAFFAQTAVFILGFAAGRPYVSRNLLTVLAAVNSVCVMLTFSRGAYVALIASFIVLCLLKRRMLLIVSAAVIVIALSAGYALVPGAVIDRVTMLQTDSGELESSAMGRLIVWDMAVKLFADNPLFGAGFDTFRFLAGYGGLHDTHNYYLKLAAEMGVLGLLVFFVLLAAALWSCWKLFRNTDDPTLMGIALGGIGCMVCVALGNVFGDRWSYLEITGYTCIILGMVARGNLMLLDPEEDEEYGDQSGEEDGDGEEDEDILDSEEDGAAAGEPEAGVDSPRGWQVAPSLPDGRQLE